MNSETKLYKNIIVYTQPLTKIVSQNTGPSLIIIINRDISHSHSVPPNYQHGVFYLQTQKYGELREKFSENEMHLIPSQMKMPWAQGQRIFLAQWCSSP